MYGANRLAGNNAGTGGSGTEQDFSPAISAINLVGNGHIPEHDWNHLVAGELAAAPDGIRDFRRLAEGVTDASTAVTDHHQRAEIETASAFHNFGRAIDEDDLLG